MIPSPASAPQTIAVTGASGFVGGAIARALLAQGHRLRILTRRPFDLLEAGDGERAPSPSASQRHAISYVSGDLNSDPALQDLLEGADAAIHCAGLTRAPNATHFSAVNAVGTRRLVLAANAAQKARGAEAQPLRFVQMSSLAARRPDLSAYARSKRAGEQALGEAAAPELQWTALRPGAIYGPGDVATLPCFRLARRIGLLPAPLGRGAEARFTLNHVDDVARAAIAALRPEIEARRIYELDDGAVSGHVWRDVAEASARALGRNIRLAPTPFWLSYSAAVFYAPIARLSRRGAHFSPGKARELHHPDWVAKDNRFSDCADWRPLVGLSEGIAEALAWYEKRGLL